MEAADRVIAVSRPMREDILSHFRVDPARSSSSTTASIRISSGAPRRARPWLARGVREPYVLFVGRITDQKGIFHLLEAARKLPAGVQVVLCASAPDTPEIEARLRRGASRASERPVDRRDGPRRRGGAALQPRGGLRVPVGLRALRPHQPRGDGVRDAGRRLRGRRHSRGGGGRQDGPARRAGAPGRAGRGDPHVARRSRARSGHGAGRAAARGGAVQLGQRRRADARGVRRSATTTSRDRRRRDDACPLPLLSSVRGFVFDLDGCVWNGDVLNPGARGDPGGASTGAVARSPSSPTTPAPPAPTCASACSASASARLVTSSRRSRSSAR